MLRKTLSLCSRLLILAFWSATASVAQSAELSRPAKPIAATKSAAILFAQKMGMGWNLGNTLEATGDVKQNSVSAYETLWGNPITTKAMIDGIKASGFNSIRIPVAWSNLMGPDYAINTALLNRVEEVTKYGLDNDMYVIINIHWDGGWITRFPENYSESLKKYKAVWSQVAARFGGYSDHLIFESLNEESNFETLWNPYSNQPNQKQKAYDTLNSINQEFTNLIRASGGNNRERYLLIAGYTTDIARTVDPAFKMPWDMANHSMVSVHYSSPSTFTLIDKDASWGKARFTWGTPEDVKAVKTDMLPLKERFLDKGIPVVVGEFGCEAKKDPASVVKYLSTVCETAYSLGLVPMLWDAGSFYNRRELKWNNPQVAEALAQVGSKHSRAKKAH